jgi:F1F0 ATPase subunit 2
MHEMADLILAFLGGVGLGMVFFGGLWLTVRKGLRSQRPALWFFTSFLLRTSIILVGLYVLAGGHWQRLLVCLLGSIVARLIVTRLSRIENPGNLVRGGDHAA